MFSPPYHLITHHGRRIVQILQSPEEAASGPLRCLRPMVGTEVGVWRGKNAATLLARMPNLRLYLVDLWGDPAPDPASGQSLQTGEDVCREALAETEFAADRRVVVRYASPGAVGLIPEPLDFVFIDGDHRYAGCLADLRAWWPTVKPGGWLMGHDIDHAGPGGRDWGVRQAVETLCSETGTDFRAWGPPEMVFAVRRSSS